MTEFVSNQELKDNWNAKRWDDTYENISLTPKYLNYFSDEVRFPFTYNLSQNAAIDESLKKLKYFSPYEFKDEAKVLEYIHENDNLYLAVLESIAAAAEIFPDSKRVLSLYCDTESDDKFLILSIGYKTYPKNLFASLKSLKQKYLHSLEKAASGWISVVPEHISA